MVCTVDIEPCEHDVAVCGSGAVDGLTSDGPRRRKGDARDEENAGLHIGPWQMLLIQVQSEE
jgi:hypothetical protein